MLSGRALRRNEDIAIVTITPRTHAQLPLQNDEDVLRDFISGGKRFRVREVQPCHFCTAYVRLITSMIEMPLSMLVLTVLKMWKFALLSIIGV